MSAKNQSFDNFGIIPPFIHGASLDINVNVKMKVRQSIGINKVSGTSFYLRIYSVLSNKQANGKTNRMSITQSPIILFKKQPLYLKVLRK